MTFHPLRPINPLFLKQIGGQTLCGRVCEVSAAHKYVVFECGVETLGVAEDLYPQAPYLDWTYSGPMLKPTQVMVTLDYMMDEISERLAVYAFNSSLT